MLLRMLYILYINFLPKTHHGRKVTGITDFVFMIKTRSYYIIYIIGNVAHPLGPDAKVTLRRAQASNGFSNRWYVYAHCAP